MFPFYPYVSYVCEGDEMKHDTQNHCELFKNKSFRPTQLKLVGFEIMCVYSQSQQTFYLYSRHFPFADSSNANKTEVY